jgi:hypothetical protein
MKPEELLRAVQVHYKNLDGFAMKIEHYDSSGLYPGRFDQTLRWRKGGRFELTISSPDNQKVPNFYADGVQTLALYPDGRRSIGELRPDPNTAPGWEVTGGLIVSWLEHTESCEKVFHPKEGLFVQWELGPRVQWRDHPVVEIVGVISNQDKLSTLSFFVNPEEKRLIGLETLAGDRTHAALYLAQKENPDLPDTLGVFPQTGR